MLVAFDIPTDQSGLIGCEVLFDADSLRVSNPLLINFCLFFYS